MVERPAAAATEVGTITRCLFHLGIKSWLPHPLRPNLPEVRWQSLLLPPLLPRVLPEDGGAVETKLTKEKISGRQWKVN